MPKEERQDKLAALVEESTIDGEPLSDNVVCSNIGKRIKSLAILGAAIESFLAFIIGIVLLTAFFSNALLSSISKNA